MSTGNLILDRLSLAMRKEVTALTEEVRLPAKTTLFVPEEPPGQVLFLTSGIAAIKVRMPRGLTSCVAVYGSSAGAGILALLDHGGTGSLGTMEIEGSALRLSMKQAREFFDRSKDFRDAMLLFVQDHIRLSEQMIVCTEGHAVETRLARWLLSCSDMVKSPIVSLTQQCLSEMIAAQRSTVAALTSAFQREGLIEQRRGSVEILNGLGLAAKACSCYPVWRATQEKRQKEVAEHGGA